GDQAERSESEELELGASSAGEEEAFDLFAIEVSVLVQSEQHPKVARCDPKWLLSVEIPQRLCLRAELEVAVKRVLGRQSRLRNPACVTRPRGRALARPPARRRQRSPHLRLF